MLANTRIVSDRSSPSMSRPSGFRSAARGRATKPRDATGPAVSLAASSAKLVGAAALSVWPSRPVPIAATMLAHNASMFGCRTRSLSVGDLDVMICAACSAVSTAGALPEQHRVVGAEHIVGQRGLQRGQTGQERGEVVDRHDRAEVEREVDRRFQIDAAVRLRRRGRRHRAVTAVGHPTRCRR